MRYRRLFDSAPDGVTISDKDATILECSQSVADLYGYNHPEELVGKRMPELMSENSLKVFKEQFQFLKTLKTGE